MHRFGCAGVVHRLDVDSATLRECAHLSLDIHHVRERIVFLHDDELFRILVGKRTEQHSIDHAEYRRVCADAEGEGEDGDGGEAGGLAQHAEAEANVLQELLEPNETPHLACLFFDAGHIAKFAQRRITCFFLRRPLRLALLGLLLQMKLKLLLQLLFFPAPLRQPAQLPEECIHRASRSPGLKINPMARENAFHFECSLANCFRPRVVSW